MRAGESRDDLLGRVVAFAGEEGIAGRSLRQIAIGAGTSHRMLLYHFGSREGLMAAIVGVIEAQQRAVMASIAASASSPQEVMRGVWEQVSGPEVRPFVRLFFEVFGLAAQGVPGTEAMLTGLTDPWLEAGVAAADRLGQGVDAETVRLGVAVSRGLLLDLLAGADPAQVTAAHERFVALLRQAAEQPGRPPDEPDEPGEPPTAPRHARP